jgi:methionine-S-sulfoxide reductase
MSSRRLEYQPYDPAWKDAFQRLRDHLDHHLNPWLDAILHVGSTSVEGLGAKPILDVDCVFTNHFEIIKTTLERLGYRYQGELGIPDRHAFEQPVDTPFMTHHLYVIRAGSDNLWNHLSVQRALRNRPVLRHQYMELKRGLIRANDTDRVRYTDGKTTFITTILKEESTMNQLILAGGCFWGVEAYFKQLEGVLDTEVGYIGASGKPTYQQVCAGSGHTEAVWISYDDSVVSLEKLLDHFFHIIDPTSINKQGPDRGVQYRTGIYNYTPEEEVVLKDYLARRQTEYKKPLAIELSTGWTFYEAETYHQDYLDKNPSGYCHVNLSSYKDVR